MKSLEMTRNGVWEKWSVRHVVMATQRPRLPIVQGINTAQNQGVEAWGRGSTKEMLLSGFKSKYWITANAVMKQMCLLFNGAAQADYYYYYYYSALSKLLTATPFIQQILSWSETTLSLMLSLI
jgi:hypothetical protein